MPEIDHIFVLTEPEAPEAEHLIGLGMIEGPPNTHPGQGTACRRFFFQNFMLELVWVRDEAEAAQGAGRELGLLQRWKLRRGGSSPFGVLLRPSLGEEGQPANPPFSWWDYRPVQMPDLRVAVATEAGLGEPFWGYLPYRYERRVPERHRSDRFHILTGTRLICPDLRVATMSLQMQRLGVLNVEEGPSTGLMLEFDGGAAGCLDLRPGLPLNVSW